MVERDGWYRLEDDDPLFVALHGIDVAYIDDMLHEVVEAGVDLNKVVHEYDWTSGIFFSLLDVALTNAPSTTPILFLRYGLDPNAPDATGETPLSKIDLMTTEVVDAFLAAGARVDTTDAEGRTPIFRACYDPENQSTVELLLNAGADVAAIDHHGQIPLHEATSNEYDCPDLVRLLLESGSPVDVADHDGRTPLLNAALCGHIETVRLLLERGADALRALKHPSFAAEETSDAHELVRNIGIAAEQKALRDALDGENGDGGKGGRRRL